MTPQTTQAISVRCQNCGAPLQLTGDVRFVTCNFCQSELEIVHDATVTHSRLLSTIAANTAAIHDDLQAMQIRKDIDDLDRDWAGWMRRTLPDGGLVPQPKSTKILSWIIAALATGLAAWLLWVTRIPWYLIVGGWLILGFVLTVNALHTHSVAEVYARNVGRYRALRQSLIDRFMHLRSRGRQK